MVCEAPAESVTTRLTVDSNTVSGKPPQRDVSTGARPNQPPIISTKNATITTIHAPSSHARQKGRQQLAAIRPIISAQATNGRHCSA